MWLYGDEVADDDDDGGDHDDGASAQHATRRVCVRVCVGFKGGGLLMTETSADSQERRVNGARESVPSPNDEAKDHEDQDDGPCHGHHSNDDDRVLLTGHNCS